MIKWQLCLTDSSCTGGGSLTSRYCGGYLNCFSGATSNAKILGQLKFSYVTQSCNMITKRPGIFDHINSRIIMIFISHHEWMGLVNFINILRTLFSPIFWRQKISNPKHSFVIFGAKLMYEKYTRKILMILVDLRVRHYF